jgi:hypothetical protein
MDINSTFSSYPELASATSSSAQTLSSINVLSFVSTEIELPPLKEMMNHCTL